MSVPGRNPCGGSQGVLDAGPGPAGAGVRGCVPFRPRPRRPRPRRGGGARNSGRGTGFHARPVARCVLPAVRRGGAHNLRSPDRSRPARPEVLHGEGGGHDQQHGQRGHAPAFQTAPRLEPQREPLPHGEPGPVPPRARLPGRIMRGRGTCGAGDRPTVGRLARGPRARRRSARRRCVRGRRPVGRPAFCPQGPSWVRDGVAAVGLGPGVPGVPDRIGHNARGHCRVRPGGAPGIAVRPRRAVPRLAPPLGVFGEERVGTQPKGRGRSLVTTGPGSPVVTAMAAAAAAAAAAVGVGATTRSAGRGRGA